MSKAESTRKRFSVILLVPLLALIALGAWAFASPVGSSPDDDFHLISIWCADGGGEHCSQGTATDNRMVSTALQDIACYAYDEEESAQCQRGIIEHASDKETLSKRGNFTGTYPPLYYATMGLFSGEDILASAVLMRLINVVLFIGLATALFVLLPSRRRNNLAWGWLVTLVPLGMFLVASNNPSSWAIMGVGSSWLALLGYFESDGRRKIALGGLFLLSVFIAAGSRSDAAFFTVGAIVTVLVLKAVRERGFLLSALLPAVGVVVSLAFLLTAGQTGSGVGGFSQVASGGGGSTVADVPLNPLGLVAFNLLNLPDLWTGVFGGWGLGWLDTQLPAIVLWSSAAAFIGVAFVGLAAMSWRKMIALSGTTLVLIILPVYVLYQSNTHVGRVFQARYILPLIVILALVLAYAPAGRAFRLSRVQQWAVIFALSLANFVALQVNIRRYVTGIDQPGVSLDAGAEWWWSGVPFSANAVWLVGSVAFAALVIILVKWASRPVPVDDSAQLLAH